MCVSVSMRGCVCLYVGACMRAQECVDNICFDDIAAAIISSLDCDCDKENELVPKRFSTFNLLSLSQLTLSLCPLFQLKERWENLLFLSMTKSKFFSEGQLNENYFDPFKTIKSRWWWFKMFLSKRLSEVMIEAFNIFNALKEFNIKFRRRYDHIVTPRSNLFH